VRRTIMVIVLSVLASGAFALPLAAASAPSWPATFRGLTDQQLLPIQLDVVQLPDGSLGLNDLFLELEISCPTGERIGLGTGVFYFPALPLDGHDLRIDEIYGNEAFHLSARVGFHQVRGTVTMALAAFTADEQLQRCDAPTQRFTAQRVADTAGTAVAARAPDVQTRFLVRPGGLSVKRSIELGTAQRPLAAGPLHYRGKTAQHLPIDFRVRGTRGRGSLAEARFALRIRCDDGTSAGTWGFGITWIGGGPPVRDGSFAIDDVEFDQAFHWSGHLGAQRARGRIAFELPAFMQDEQLQRCGSGSVRWRARAV
jgi:hypothetical protein